MWTRGYILVCPLSWFIPYISPIYIYIYLYIHHGFWGLFHLQKNWVSWDDDPALGAGSDMEIITVMAQVQHLYSMGDLQDPKLEVR